MLWHVSFNVVLSLLHWNSAVLCSPSPEPSDLEVFASQDIFEETPDKDRFVGDVMFWKFFEDIDANRIYHTNSVEYRTVFPCLDLH